MSEYSSHSSANFVAPHRNGTCTIGAPNGVADRGDVLDRNGVLELEAPHLMGDAMCVVQDKHDTPFAGKTCLDQLMEKLRTRTATIGVLGMGYVGLPLAVAFAEAGFATVGFDTTTRITDGLRRGESHIGDVADERVQALRESGKFSATTDFDELSRCDVSIICVPTPLTEMREPDLSAVRAASVAVHDHLHPAQLVVLESTTYPGTTDEVVRPLLEQTGLRAGTDFFLAFSPERIDPGNIKFPVHKVPKVVGGHTGACRQAAVELYSAIVEQTVPVSCTRTAELTKLLENIFRSVNIALVNEMALLCDRMDLDIWEVIDSAATKPYGFTKFLPGPGLGGHCIPLDPFYLSWKARQYEFQTNFIELAGEVNRAMPRHVVTKITRALNDQGKAVRNARIVVLGMSYKPNVSDCRESPSLCVTELLLELGAEVSFNDPYVPSVRVAGQTFVSQPLEDILADADCVVLLTHHRDYDYEYIAATSAVIVDTRNAFKDVQDSKAQIIKL
jgi:UDP-N-acetyl-D-glucosamine dehydrogenase